MNTFDTVSRIAGDILVWVALVLSVVFIVLYQVLARWEKSQFGVQTMLSSISVLILLALGIWEASTHNQDYPGKLFVRALTVLGLCAMLVWRIYLLLREQKRARAIRNHPSTPQKEEFNGPR